MSRFEDNLWAQLEREQAPVLRENLATQRRKRTTRWMGAAAGVAVLGGVAVATYLGGTPPAYAVVDNPDGSVTLTVREVQRFEEATAKLRDRGIPAVAVPLRQNCSDAVEPLPEQGVAAVDFQFSPEAFKITISRDRIPATGTVVLAADQATDHWIVTGGLYARDQLPSCLPERGSR